MNSNSGIANASSSGSADQPWGFLTKHAHVLLCVAHDPGARLRDIATTLGVTERSVHKIVSDLVAAGYVTRERQGRRNRYEIKRELAIRDPMGEGREIGELLELLLKPSAAGDGNGAPGAPKPPT
jgi:DNA-binding transcriptional ArsR family regulator